MPNFTNVQIKLNQRGAGIIELAIALLLLTYAGLAILKLSEIQQRNAEYVLVKMELAHIGLQLQAVQQLCANCQCPDEVMEKWRKFGKALENYNFTITNTAAENPEPKCRLLQSASINGLEVRLESELS